MQIDLGHNNQSRYSVLIGCIEGSPDLSVANEQDWALVNEQHPQRA
jgi:hypothetical protein